MKINSVRQPTEFFLEIETIVTEFNVNYLDAILMYVEKNNLEVESVAAIVKKHPTIKSRLQEDCEGLNLLERQARLPI
jgi:hypothetical protein